MKGVLPIVAIIVLSLLAIGTTVVYYETNQNYIIDGNKVYIDDSNLYLSAEPHTLSNSGEVIFNLISKNYEGSADIVFGFDYPTTQPKTAEYYNPTVQVTEESFTCDSPYWFNYTTTPKMFYCWRSLTQNATSTANASLIFSHSYDRANLQIKTAYWNVSKNVDWYNIASSFTPIDYDYGGMTRWYYKSFNVIKNHEYTLKSFINIPLNNIGKHKYWVCIKPSAETIEQAKTNGHLYCLDPWYEPMTFSYRNKIIENKTTEGVVSVNDTRGVNGDIIWLKSSNESYIYSSGTGISGVTGIANETDQKSWENETSGTGNDIQNIWNEGYAVLHMNNITIEDIYGLCDATTTTATATPGKFGTAMLYDNTHWTRINKNCMEEDPSTLFPNGYTISMWVRMNGTTYTSGAAHDEALFSKWDEGGYGQYMSLISATGKLRWVYYYDTSNSYEIFSTTNSWTANNWYNIVFQLNSSLDNESSTTGRYAKIFINGVLQTTFYTSDIPNWRANDEAALGRLYSTVGGTNDYGRGFGGVIDEVKIYSRVLSRTEIFNEYNTGYNTSTLYNNMTKIGAEETYIGDRIDITNNTANTTSTAYYSTFTTNITALNHSTTTTVDTVWFEFNNANATGIKVIDMGNGGIYSFTRILNVTPGQYTIKQFANDTTGNEYTNASTYFNITVTELTNNTVTLSATSWTIVAGSSSNVSCIAGTGTATLYRNGVVISNPESTTLGIGSYNYSCLVSATGYVDKTAEHILVVTPGGVDCTDSSAYLYGITSYSNADQTVFNLTYYVEQHLVREDLNDVLSATAGVTVYKSIVASNYYLMVNDTNVTNPFTIYFGNYIANESLSNITMTNTTMTSFTPNLVTPYYYTVDTIDEMSSVRQQPPSTNVTRITLYCSDGSTTFNVNDTQFTIPAYSQLTRMRYTITYSALEVYYRDLLINNPYEYKTFYLADAIDYQVLQIIMKLQDNTLDFPNATLHIKKTVGSTWVTITELPFDAEKKAIVYLINGQEYQVSVKNLVGDERVIGNLYADSVSLDKTIVINDALVTNAYEGNTSMNYTYNNDTGVIEFAWRDPEGNTNLTEMYVYNYTNKTQLMFYGSCTNPTTCTITYTVPNMTQAYLVNMKVHHYIYGLNTLDVTVIMGWFQNLIENVLPVVSSQVRSILGAVFIIMLVMIFGAIHSATGGVIISLMALVLSFLQVLPMNNYVLALAVFLSIVNKATERKVLS